MYALHSPLQVVAIAGSLHAASYNRGGGAPIPLYNADVEAQGDPSPVAELKAAVREADALLIAVAEHNYGVSG